MTEGSASACGADAAGDAAVSQEQHILENYGDKSTGELKRLLESLSGMEKQIEKFADKVGTLGTHLKNAQQSYSESDTLFERAQNTLETMLGAGVPELPFEDPPATLVPPREASAKKGG